MADQKPTQHLPHRDAEQKALAAKESARLFRDKCRREYERLAVNDAFEGWVLRQLKNLDGHGQEVYDDVFSVQSNEMIRREARRSLGQKLLDEMYQISPAMYARVNDELMKKRSERLERGGI